MRDTDCDLTSVLVVKTGSGIDSVEVGANGTIFVGAIANGATPGHIFAVTGLNSFEPFLHYDAHDICTLQIHGRKRWRLYDRATRAAARSRPR